MPMSQAKAEKEPGEEKEAFPEEGGESREPSASETTNWSFKEEEYTMMLKITPGSQWEEHCAETIANSLQDMSDF